MDITSETITQYRVAMNSTEMADLKAVLFKAAKDYELTNSQQEITRKILAVPVKPGVQKEVKAPAMRVVGNGGKETIDGGQPGFEWTERE